MIKPLPDPKQLFARFDTDAGSDSAARDRFELFVTDLVSVRYEGATTVAARNHNDWGLDTFVGELSDGDVLVWQSKYFLEWQDEKPQQQVRDSFKSVQAKAGEHGYRIAQWTLVVPAILEPKQYAWFSTWAKKQERATGTTLRLWQGDKLRRRMQSTEAFAVRREYFPHTIDEGDVPVEEVALSDDYSAFEDALFVRQLREAGHVETSAACGLYFATDALVRDLEAKRSESQLRAFGAVQLGVRHVWENEFNDRVSSADSLGRMPSLYRAVITGAAEVADSPGLRLASAHRQGAVHMLVEQQKAGWVLHWRAVADSHQAVPSDEPVADEIEQVTQTLVEPARGASTEIELFDKALGGRPDHA